MKPITRRLILSHWLLLWPAVGLCDTFEIQDPAAEIFNDLEARTEVREPKPGEPALNPDELFCAVDEQAGTCWCVHRENAAIVTIEPEQCIELASETAGQPAR